MSYQHSLNGGIQTENSLKINHFGIEVRSNRNNRHATLFCYLGKEMPQNIRDNAEK